MKIYTKTGDDGTTGLFGGERRSKSDARIACIGEIDELNAAIGLTEAQTEGTLSTQLREVQKELFVIGAMLAAPQNPPPQHVPILAERSITRLEQEIDSAESDLPPLQHFILPGGFTIGAGLHLARTICRRAERTLVNFSQQTPLPKTMLIYLNRLSDWLFVQARLANHNAGVPEEPWIP